MMKIKSLNESFRRLYEETCEDCEDELTFEDIEVDPSVEGELTEAKISPEDQHDSDVIRSIYSKLRNPGRVRFSAEEKAVMQKYDIEPDKEKSWDPGAPNRWYRGEKASIVANTKDKNGQARIMYDLRTPENIDAWDKVNLADRARKMPDRMSKYDDADKQAYIDSYSWLNPNKKDSRYFIGTKNITRGQNGRRVIADNSRYADELRMKRFGKTPKHESLKTNRLDEAISPEDKYDSDLIRSIYAKANAPGARMDRLRGSLTPEEKEVFDKYNLSFGTKHSKYWGRNMFSNGKEVFLSKAPFGHSDYAVSKPDVNLADLARKRNTRDPHSGYWIYGRGKHLDDELPSKVQNDKYAVKDISRKNRGFSDEIKDLETRIKWRKDDLKKIKKNPNGRLFHYSDADIDRMEADLAGKKASLNNLKKKQPYYDEKRRQALDDFYMNRFGKTPKHESYKKKSLKEEIKIFNNISKDLLDGSGDRNFKPLITGDEKCSKSAINNLKFLLNQGKNVSLCFGNFKRDDEPAAPIVTHVWVKAGNDIIQTNEPKDEKYREHKLHCIKEVPFTPQDFTNIGHFHDKIEKAIDEIESSDLKDLPLVEIKESYKKKYLKESRDTSDYDAIMDRAASIGRRLMESKSSEYTIQQVDENKIRELENGSAFTWEGMNIDDDNLQAIVEFFKEQTPSIKLPIHFFTWNGDLFNDMYGLTGSNAYPDDLTFLSIDLDNWKEMGNLPMVKMQIGARWLDDIVDNNARIESMEDTWYEEGQYDEDDEYDEDDFEESLNEAKISPEDKHDSDVIRGIYAKMGQFGRKNFTKEEKAIMDKYDLDFSRDSAGRRDNMYLINKPTNKILAPKFWRASDREKVNYADMARKVPERLQDDDYRRNNPRWSYKNRSVVNPKQTSSRWVDDYMMQQDYRNKYRDLYKQARDVSFQRKFNDAVSQGNDRTIARDKEDIKYYQDRIARLEKEKEENQKKYDQKRADWKKTLADRRAKKNESLNESTDEVTVGIYGDEVPRISSVDGLVAYFKSKGITVSNVSGDMDYGWEMELTADPKTLFFAVCNRIPGYNSESVQDFIDDYEI